MTLKMTRHESETFLAGVHVAVVGISEEGRGPLITPVWYWYEPGGDVWFETQPDSRRESYCMLGSESAFAHRMKTHPTRT